MSDSNEPSDAGHDEPADSEVDNRLYRVVLSSAAVRSLGAIPTRIAEPLLTFIFLALAENPRRRGKPLVADFAGLWSARRGDYRVIYGIDDEVWVVDVVRIAHRSEAYRQR